MKQVAKVFLSCFLLLFVFANVASAHVVVLPEETTQGAYEVFTVRVPTEKEIPTTKVQVTFSNDVKVSRFEPKPGWKYEITKDANDKITSVTWIATGNGIGATEFEQFNMQGKVSDTAKEIVWKAVQTYKDGSVVEWVGAEDSDSPASVTKVHPKQENTQTDHHSHHATSPTKENTSETSGQTDNTSNLPLYISLIALVLGIVAIVVSLRKRT
jgi:uncharacterized protein YcnI